MGETVLVTYLPADRAESTLGDARERLENEIESVLGAAVILPAIGVWANIWSIRAVRRKRRSWSGKVGGGHARLDRKENRRRLLLSVVVVEAVLAGWAVLSGVGPLNIAAGVTSLSVGAAIVVFRHPLARDTVERNSLFGFGTGPLAYRFALHITTIAGVNFAVGGVLLLLGVPDLTPVLTAER